MGGGKTDNKGSKSIMKRLLLSLMMGGAMLAANSFAYTFTDADSINATLHDESFCVDGVWTYQNNFNIAAGDGTGVAGYNSADWTITDAWAEFVFRSTDCPEESIRIKLSGLNFYEGSSKFDLVVGNEVVGDALLDLQTDGVVAYKVKLLDTGEGLFLDWVYDDVLLESAFLGANAIGNQPPQPTPDGGATVALLGLGILGLFGLRRKAAK